MPGSGVFVGKQLLASGNFWAWTLAKIFAQKKDIMIG